MKNFRLKNLAKLSLLLATSALIFNCSSESINTEDLSIDSESTERGGRERPEESDEPEVPEPEVTETKLTQLEAENYNSMSGIQTEASS